MEYTKIICQLSPDNEINRQVLMAEMGNLGFESFDETKEVVDAYIPSKDFNDALLKEDSIAESPLFSVEFQIEIIPDQNWNEVWEKNYFKPLIIEGRCVIRAPFHTDYPDAEFEIVIEPQMAFGTGNHETTKLMIKSILETDVKGKKILDMGCGTGILGILTSMLGAKKVTGIDIDEWSYRCTIETAELNHIQNLETKPGDARLLGDETFDIILANIQRNILLQDMEQYVNVLNPGGTLIMSGFYTRDIVPIKEKAENLGLKDAGYKELNNWVAHRYIRQ